MVFFVKRAIDAVKLLLLITIGFTAKLTYDLTTTSYDLEAENKYTHEQKIDEKFSHEQSSPRDNFEIAAQSNIPDHKKSKTRDQSYFDKRHLFVESFTTTPSSPIHNAFSDVRFVATSFSPIKISVLKSIRTKSHEHAVRVSGNNTSNGTTNDDLNYLNDTVLFAFDSYELDQAALLILEGQIEHLRENKNLLVTVEGHADELGTREYNLGLGERRASRVKDHFLTAGINAARIKTISYGKERPLIEGSSDYARSKNRRAVTVFSLPKNVEAVTLPKENTATTNEKDAISKQTTLAPPVSADHNLKAPQSTFRNGRLYVGAFKQLQAGGKLGWDDIGSTTLVTRLSNFEPEKFESDGINVGYRKGNFAIGFAYANYRPFKLKGSPATIGGTNYSFFEVPVKGHSYFVDGSIYVPIRKNSVDFSLTAGLGTAKLITGYAGVDGTDSVTNFYTNSAVNFTRYGAGLDFYLSPSLILSTGLVQSKYDDFGITIDTAGTANVTAKNMKINEVNIGLKKYF